MITPIRCGVDTLEATFGGELDFWVEKEFSKRKIKAQIANAPEPIRMCCEDLSVCEKGAGFWEYVVRNRDLMLKVSLAENVPPMGIRLMAEGLASRGVTALWSKTRELGAELGLTPSNLTRIDVAVDFQGWTPTFEEMQSVVCKSGFRPIYPSTNAPETFQFGKGQVVMRLYNKTKEITVTNKGWWHNVWKLCGYDPSLPVWRLEVQLRSTALKELDRRSVDTALSDIYGLFCYGLDWCSLRVPNGDSNLRRAPEHQAWIDLREQFKPARALGRIRPVVRVMGYDAAVARLAGLYATAGAASGLSDYDELCGALKTDVLIFIHNRREMGFADLVEEKRRRMDSGE